MSEIRHKMYGSLYAGGKVKVMQYEGQVFHAVFTDFGISILCMVTLRDSRTSLPASDGTTRGAKVEENE